MNKAILIGRLTRDPELRYTPSNRAVCQFTIAIDRPFTNQSTGQREADPIFTSILFDSSFALQNECINLGCAVIVVYPYCDGLPSAGSVFR